jgi:acyl-coenzyme A thioesterase PaaI-like protein
MKNEKRSKAFQDYYTDEVSCCYGCGRLNEDGLQIKSYWDGDEAVCTYTPRSYHTAIPGFVYGGLIASLIDCHSTGTAAAAAYRAENRDMDSEPRFRYVTASLKVDYLKPTPIDRDLTVRAKVGEISGRKVVVHSTLHAGDDITARGEVIVVQMPEDWLGS